MLGSSDSMRDSENNFFGERRRFVDSRVAVIGAGMMGHGIALHCAISGANVALTDKDPARLESALRWMEGDLRILRDHGLAPGETPSPLTERVSLSAGVEEAAAQADFVFEAVYEDLGVKQGVFRELDEHAPPEAVLATTTSSLRVADIADVVSDPGRVLGAHWANPPHILPLVEVVLGPATSEEAHGRLTAFLRKVGKAPVTCRDVAGYIVNRLQYAMLNEAVSLVERGLTTPEDVDEAVRHGFGIRLACKGPFEWNDLLHDADITLNVFENLYRAEGDPKFKPSALLLKQIERGELGLSTGRGWRDYGGRSQEELIQERDTVVLRAVRALRELGIIQGAPTDRPS